MRYVLLNLIFFGFAGSVLSQLKVDSSLKKLLIKGSYSDVIVFIESSKKVNPKPKTYYSDYNLDTAISFYSFINSNDTSVSYSLIILRVNDTIEMYRLTKFTEQGHVLGNTFNNSFSRRLKSINEAIKFDIIYGTLCGYHGSMLPYREKLNLAISKKDIKLLDKWLISTVSEIRVYAVEGFHSLAKIGYKLSPKQKALISSVKKEITPIRTCLGCFIESTTIKEATKEFVFD